MAGNDEKTNKIKQTLEQLENGVRDVFTSDKYIQYLATMSRFHRYSFRNAMLIFLQRPDASRVAGFTSWRDKFNRHVNKGEKGIAIFAPAPFKTKKDMEVIDPNTQLPKTDELGNAIIEEVEITIPYFKVVYVYDVSQTSGEPLPDYVTELSAAVTNYDAFLESLKISSAYPVSFEEIKGGAHGYCDSTAKKVAINIGMSQSQTIKTTVHELAHAELHSSADSNFITKHDRSTGEVEAESIAYVVCQNYGIETADYSFGYIAGWSQDKELKDLHSSLDVIQSCSMKLIDRIDSYYRELVKAPEYANSNIANDVSYEFNNKEHYRPEHER